MTSRNGRSQKPSTVPVLLMFAAVILVWAVTPFVMKFFFIGMAERGQAGDLYGSINALFSGLAFAGVIVAILLQREELSLQRQELIDNRAELIRSANAQEESQKALNKTIYAQTFKVALDIIESQDALSARGYIAHFRKDFDLPVSFWSKAQLTAAEAAARKFESVGTMVRQGLLPAAYIIDTWSVPIHRNWHILAPYIQKLRADRSDPYAGRDFEMLAHLSAQFLSDNKTT
ncbi:hypothetical protein [Mesorhizobium sp. IMUNJ 23232]|uniref:DUF4760 domain-containing protein n=1 Tax=Mesorhizobium sp. IMUNJ 23232 TaxID=3376064 RepID=UPI003790D045